MSDLLVHPVALVGGLELSKAKPDPSDFVRLQNFNLFRGRFALRAPVLLTTTLTTHDTNATSALAGAFHDGKLFVAVHRSANTDVRLWELTATGTFVADRGAIWTGITGPIPRPVMSTFEGGSATAGTKRLYICDYDGQQDTRFWNGTTLATLQVDFDNSGTAENIKFHYLFSYQFHLWGAGFLEGTSGRSELLRFSQPGLIPKDDPDTTLVENVEWFVADFRPVGRRGDKITALNATGGPMIVFKDRQCYALFGYDAQSWAIRQLSERAGAVGPYATASTGDGLCFFWSERGPHVTDGQEVVDISEPVRKHVLEAEVSDKVVVGFSPDDGLVYFVYPRGGATDPDIWLAYDKERQRFSEGEGLAVGGGLLKVRHAVIIPSTVLPGPVGAPSGLTATAVSESQIDLTWTNGDFALDTETEIYLDTANPPTTLRETVGSGVASRSVTGLTAKTTYFARVRHKRNNQFSGYSNVPSAKTFLARPTSPSATRLSNGVQYKATNNEALADVVIERKLSTDTGWAVLVTLVAQPTGVFTHNDTTTTCGLTYDYRSKVKKTGETDSLFSTIVSSVACQNPSLTSCSHLVDLVASCGSPGTTASVTWVGANLRAGDRVKVFRNVAGGGYVERADVPATDGFYTDPWDVKSGTTSTSLQYRLDLLDQGGPVVSQCTTTLSNHNVDTCLQF